MGLSNEERLAKMTWAANHLTQLAADLPDESWLPTSDKVKYARLKALCGQVWHAMLGGKANGAHWILGSSASNEIKESESPWAVALENHFRESHEGKGWLEEAKAERQKAYEEADDTDALLSPWDEEHAEQAISIASLLKKLELDADMDEGYAQTALDKVFLIYAATEGMSYALRRYPDKFLADFPTMDKLVSDIQGECFNCYQKDSRFALAYLFHQILDAHFCNYGNPIRDLAIKQGWMVRMASRARIHFAAYELNLKAMREWHLRIESHKVKTATDWVELALEIMGHRANDDMRETLRIAGKMEIELDAARVKAAYAKAAKAEEEYKKFSARDYSGESRQAHLYAVHGHESFEACKTDEEKAEDARRRKSYPRSRKAKTRKAPKFDAVTMAEQAADLPPHPQADEMRKADAQLIQNALAPIREVVKNEHVSGDQEIQKPHYKVTLDCGHIFHRCHSASLGEEVECDDCLVEVSKETVTLTLDRQKNAALVDKVENGVPSPLGMGAREVVTRKVLSCMEAGQGGYWVTPDCGHTTETLHNWAVGGPINCVSCTMGRKEMENPPRTVEAYYPNVDGHCLSILSCGHHVYDEPALTGGQTWYCKYCNQCRTVSENSAHLIQSGLRTRLNKAEIAKDMFPVQSLPDGAKVLYDKEPEATEVKPFPMPFMLKMPKIISEKIDTGGKTHLNVAVTDENWPVPTIMRGLTKVPDDNVQAALNEADGEEEMLRDQMLLYLNGMTRSELLRMAMGRKVRVVWNTKTLKAKMVEDLLPYMLSKG
jgi:hypothetical protein